MQQFKKDGFIDRYSGQKLVNADKALLEDSYHRAAGQELLEDLRTNCMT